MPQSAIRSPAFPPQTAPQGGLDAVSQARRELLDRLCEVVCWPASRMSLHERDLAGDLLIGLLASAPPAQRQRLAERLAGLTEASKPLLRYLACDAHAVADGLLRTGLGLDESDLLAAIDEDRPGHALSIAARRSLGPCVSEALIAIAIPEVTAAVLRNPGAHLSAGAVELVLAHSRNDAALPPLLATRPELRATQALIMFWWADPATRATILRRFAVDRSVLVGELGSVFLTAAAERWQDAEARQALLMVERRQRTRLDTRGEKAELEVAVARLAQRGFDALLVAEVAHQTSLRAVTAVRVFKDESGEPVAVWAKASGLRRAQFESLWQGLQGEAAFTAMGKARRERALYAFDTLATAKAQGVLRVWNWAIGSEAELVVAPTLTLNGRHRRRVDDVD